MLIKTSTNCTKKKHFHTSGTRRGERQRWRFGFHCLQKKFTEKFVMREIFGLKAYSISFGRPCVSKRRPPGGQCPPAVWHRVTTAPGSGSQFLVCCCEIETFEICTEINFPYKNRCYLAVFCFAILNTKKVVFTCCCRTRRVDKRHNNIRARLTQFQSICVILLFLI